MWKGRADGFAALSKPLSHTAVGEQPTSWQCGAFDSDSSTAISGNVVLQKKGCF